MTKSDGIPEGMAETLAALDSDFADIAARSTSPEVLANLRELGVKSDDIRAVAQMYRTMAAALEGAANALEGNRLDS